MSAHCLLNGEPVDATAFADRACQYGDGLFETIAVIDGVACQMQRHLARLRQGCKALLLPLPDEQMLENEILGLVRGQSRGVLKVIWSAGLSGRGYQRDLSVPPTRFLQLTPWPSGEIYGAPIGLRLTQCNLRLGEQPLLAGIKHLNRLEQVLARAELHANHDEGLLLDQAGNPVCGTMSNLYLFTDGQWLVPTIEGAGVAGIVREVFLAEATNQGAACEVRPVSMAALQSADALFMSNSLMGMRQVMQFDDRSYTALSLPIVDRVNQLSLNGAAA